MLVASGVFVTVTDVLKHTREPKISAGGQCPIVCIKRFSIIVGNDICIA